MPTVVPAPGDASTWLAAKRNEFRCGWSLLKRALSTRPERCLRELKILTRASIAVTVICDSHAQAHEACDESDAHRDESCTRSPILTPVYDRRRAATLPPPPERVPSRDQDGDSPKHTTG
eukprot:IDg22653t1